MSPSSSQPDNRVDGSPKFRAPAMPEIECIDDLVKIEYQGELDGGEPQLDNISRASFAARAVEAYAKATRSTDEPIETCVSDLLSDMRHLIDVLAESGEDGGEFSSIEGLMDRGGIHYEAEIRGVF